MPAVPTLSISPFAAASLEGRLSYWWDRCSVVYIPHFPLPFPLTALQVVESVFSSRRRWALEAIRFGICRMWTGLAASDSEFCGLLWKMENDYLLILALSASQTLSSCYLYGVLPGN